MIKHFECNPDDIKMAIGPHISKEKYRFDRESYYSIIKEFHGTERFFYPYGRDQYCFDLNELNIKQAIDMGISKRNIAISDFCTFSRPDLFFSERRDGKPTGRFGAGIMLI